MLESLIDLATNTVSKYVDADIAKKNATSTVAAPAGSSPDARAAGLGASLGTGAIVAIAAAGTALVGLNVFMAVRK